MLVDMCMLLHVCSMQPAKGNMLKRILLTYSLLEQVSSSGRCTINCKNHLTQCPLIVDSWTWYDHGANIMYSSRASHHHIAWLVDFRLCQFSVCLCVPDGPYVSQCISCFVFILLWDMYWRIWMCFEYVLLDLLSCVCVGMDLPCHVIDYNHIIGGGNILCIRVLFCVRWMWQASSDTKSSTEPSLTKTSVLSAKDHPHYNPYSALS